MPRRRASPGSGVVGSMGLLGSWVDSPHRGHPVSRRPKASLLTAAAHSDVRVARLGEVRVPRVALLGEATTIANKIRKDQLHYIVAAAADRPGVLEDLAGDDADIAANGKAYAKLAGRTPEYARFRDAL